MEYTTTDPELELQSFAYFWEEGNNLMRILAYFLTEASYL